MEGYTYFFTYEETIPHRGKVEFWRMPCAMGADLSQGDDFCAFTFLFPLANGGFGIKTRSYISELTMMKLAPAYRQKYDEFLAPNQTAADVVMKEKRRELRLRALGWWVIRWTWQELKQGWGFANWLRRALANAPSAQVG